MTNQTIDGVRTLAEQACGTSPDSPEYRRFIAAMNPTLLLDLTLPAAQPQGEPVYMVRSHGSDCWEEMSGESLELCQAGPGEYEVRKLYAEQPAPIIDVTQIHDYEPVGGGFRQQETEHGVTYWLKAGGYKAALYDFVADHPYLTFYGLKWEWNGDLKVDFRWNCPPEDRKPSGLLAEKSEKTILDFVTPLVKVVRNSDMPPEKLQNEPVRMEAVCAQIRYRRPERNCPDWGPWHNLSLKQYDKNRTWFIDSIGWECETRLLFVPVVKP